MGAQECQHVCMAVPQGIQRGRATIAVDHVDARAMACQ